MRYLIRNLPLDEYLKKTQHSADRVNATQYGLEYFATGSTGPADKTGYLGNIVHEIFQGGQPKVYVPSGYITTIKQAREFISEVYGSKGFKAKSFDELASWLRERHPDRLPPIDAIPLTEADERYITGARIHYSSIRDEFESYDAEVSLINQEYNIKGRLDLCSPDLDHFVEIKSSVQAKTRLDLYGKRAGWFAKIAHYALLVFLETNRYPRASLWVLHGPIFTRIEFSKNTVKNMVSTWEQLVKATPRKMDVSFLRPRYEALFDGEDFVLGDIIL